MNASNVAGVGVRTPIAVVESIFAGAIREINALEQRIVRSEDNADGALWEQAEQVVALLDHGLSQRALAAQWINPRTGRPHSVSHVNYTARVYAVQLTEQPRPRFRDAYNALANRRSRYSCCTGCYEWNTPADLIEAARLVLGDIDLDPASSKEANAVVKAAQFFTRQDDGLAQPWQGRVWLNPPYTSPLITHFVDKLANSVRTGDVTAAIALVDNSTETRWFVALATVASALCFPTGRVHFWQPNRATPGGPSQGQAIFYVGPNVDRFCEGFASFGIVARIAHGPADGKAHGGR